MKTKNRFACAFFALIPIAAIAAPAPALQPMSFLAGACWKGAMPDGKSTDEHCFSWVYEGRYLRDVHTVHAEGRPDYMGETVYYPDPSTGKVNYLYFENSGGIGRGTAELQADKFVFPETDYLAAGFSLRYRAQWTKVDDSAYEVHNEIQGKDGKWVTQFKIKLLKQEKK